MRSLWEQNHDEDSMPKNTQGFHVTVCARFRPKQILQQKSTYKHENTKRVTLPLHQRLSIIKIANKLSSNKEAIKLLSEQGGWFNLKRNEERDEAKETNDKQLMLMDGIHTIDQENNSVIIVDPLKGLCEVKLDHILPEITSQKIVYETSTMTLVSDLFNGQNGSCLVYGQTGSGKTYTMFGEQDFESSRYENYSFMVGQKRWGIVPRACYDVFRILEERKNKLNFEIEMTVKITFIEVFGNTVSDLLHNGKLCGNNRASSQGFILDGSSEISVSSFNEAISLLKIGEGQKRKATTAMNERSTRAHNIFIFTLTQFCAQRNINLTNRLYLVDLGGCEQIKKSAMKLDASISISEESKEYFEEQIQNQKDRVKEAVNINLGLLALKQCVQNLQHGNKYVPYAVLEL